MRIDQLQDHQQQLSLHVRHSVHGGMTGRFVCSAVRKGKKRLHCGAVYGGQVCATLLCSTLTDGAQVSVVLVRLEK